MSFAQIFNPYVIIMGLIVYVSQRKKERKKTLSPGVERVVRKGSLDHWGTCHVLTCAMSPTKVVSHVLWLAFGEANCFWGCSWFQAVGTADWMICIWNCWHTYSLHTYQMVFCGVWLLLSSSLLLHRGLLFSQWQKLCPLLLQQHHLLIPSPYISSTQAKYCYRENDVVRLLLIQIGRNLW